MITIRDLLEDNTDQLLEQYSLFHKHLGIGK